MLSPIHSVILHVGGQTSHCSQIYIGLNDMSTSDQPQKRWFSCAASDVGHVRRTNEDSFLDAREQGLWVVADGMGGHSRGDRASQTIIEEMQSFAATDDAENDLNDLVARMARANNFCRTETDGQVMGSTVVALYVNAGKGYVIWAGDSRIYRLRDDDWVQLTDDHSLVQELYRLGELTAEEAENHPSSNVITRAIGVSDELDVQVRQISVESGDRYLLCSDGLFKDVQRHEVAANIRHPAPQMALDALVSLALKRGGTDNVTAIVVQMAVNTVDDTAEKNSQPSNKSVPQTA